MGYVAVSGGSEAIANAEELLTFYRLKGGASPIEVRQIREQMRLAVDKVMSEGALYAPTIAAIALKQAEGDNIEASFILRAYRATQPRRYYSLPADTGKMRVIRRISAAFQDVPGGQILGPTRDYTQRLVDFSLLEESPETVRAFFDRIGVQTSRSDQLPDSFPKIIDLLRREGLLVEPVDRKETLFDITRESISFPCQRSAKLQSLARGETGVMMALAYSSMRGFGDIHPYLGELRVGTVPLCINHPAKEQPVYIGRVLVTEAEIISEYYEDEQGKPKLTLGYGLCFGHNELKAIAMGVLDRTMQSRSPHKSPAEDEEFVLYHIDGIESSGFSAHWKLPHYVTFQSTLDRLRRTQQLREEATASECNREQRRDPGKTAPGL